MTLADSFVVQGEKVYDDTWLPLDLGWNLVSYLPENAMSVEQALESIHGMFAVVSGYDQSAMMFLPGSPFNDLEAMANGFGYWIRLNERASLNYRSDAGVMLSPPMTVFEDTPVATAAVDFTPTPLWADYYGEVDLPIGKVIEAYDADGVLCGRTTLRATQQYGFLHVYGDDANTPEDEGALPGDHITFMCDGEIIGSTSVRHGWSPGQDPQHVPLGAFSSAEETKDGLPIAYELSPNFPNPFNNSTTIRYQLPDGGKVSLQVFNLLGQKVATLVQQEMPAGYHQFVWRGAGMASGIYFLRFSVIDANGVERFRRVRKIMLLE